MQSLGENKSYSKISILEAMKLLADSWESATKEILLNCFKKAGINSDVQQAATADSDDPFKDFHKNLNELKSADPSMVPEDVTAERKVSLDDDVIAIALKIAEINIIEELCLSQQTEVEEEEDDNPDKKFI